jgi:NitT/TauT family transport system permease protein
VVSASRTKARGRTVAETVLPRWCSASFVIGVWYLISYVMLDPQRRFLLRPPHEVLQVAGFLDTEVFGEILGALWSSTRVA